MKKIKKKKRNIYTNHIKQKGSTLIEILVYIALFSILMAGVISSVYMIIDYENKQSLKNEENNELLLKKYHE